MTTQIVTAYISLGSNLGDRAGNLLLAVRGLIDAGIYPTRLSGVYETEPFLVANLSAEHPEYLNMIAEVELLNVSPEQLLARMLRVEYLLGRRRRGQEKTPRTVDLDVVLYGSLIRKNAFLTVPHPEMHLRNFVLVPLAEIAPMFIHPVINRTIKDLLKDSIDQTAVKRWQPR